MICRERTASRYSALCRGRGRLVHRQRGQPVRVWRSAARGMRVGMDAPRTSSTTSTAWNPLQHLANDLLKCGMPPQAVTSGVPIMLTVHEERSCRAQDSGSGGDGIVVAEAAAVAPQQEASEWCCHTAQALRGTGRRAAQR